MKKTPVVAAAFLMACALAGPSTLLAGGAKASVKMKKGAFEKINGAALMSVYGRYKVSGEPILTMRGQYPALEKLMEEKVTLLKNSLAAAEFLPFTFVDENTVLKSEAYATLIQDSLNRSEVSGTYVLNVFGGKSKAETGAAAVDTSRHKYFAPAGYGVYLLPPSGLEARSFGGAGKEREKLFQQMGADAIFTAEVDMAAVGLGGLVFGKEAGNVVVTINGALITPDGAKPYTFESTATSAKKTLYRMPNAGLTQHHKELVADTAVELSEQAWNDAWGALQAKMSAALAKK